MKDTLYENIVKNNLPKEDKKKNYLIAFFIGGLIGLFGEGLVNLYIYILNIPNDIASSLMLITLIFLSSLFTSLGFFDNWVNFAKCGLIIPITGFAHSMTSAGLEYKKDGPIFGLGSNVFKLAGSVIFYGVSSAFILGLIKYILRGI